MKKLTSGYQTLTLRNQGYVASDLQQLIRTTRVLIAGCGVGSTIAEAATRLGFENFILVDGDSVEAHNLNRQAFTSRDVNQKKVSALAKRIHEINPEASVIEVDAWLNGANAELLVSQADLIFDTIDFLDLAAITALHDEANVQGKPVISGVSMGWGAGVLYFPGDHRVKGSLFRNLFGLPEEGSVKDASYVKHFTVFMERIQEHMDPAIVRAMSNALTVMEDGTPCPAPHLSAGSYSLAALATTMAVRVIGGMPVTAAPELVLANFTNLCTRNGVDLRPPDKPSHAYGEMHIIRRKAQ